MTEKDSHRRSVRLTVSGAVAMLLTFCETGGAAAQGTLDASFLRALGAVQRDPADPEVSFAFVRTAIATGNVRPAIARLESLLVRDPSLANLRLELGLLYLETGSPQLAERFIGQAMEDPSAPDAVRQRAEEALRESALRQRRWSAGGEVTVGLRGETNATAAPAGTAVQFVSGGQELPAVLESEDTEQADGSFVVTLSGDVGVDLGTQAGDRLRVSGLYYGTRYFSEKQLDIDFFSGDVGPEFRLTDLFGGPASVRPYAAAALVRKDGRNFEAEYGGGVDMRLVPGERTSVRTIVDARWTDYRSTVVDPLNDRRDALLVSLASTVGYQLSPDLLVSASAEVARNAADVADESYWEAEAGVQLIQAFDDPTGLIGRPWLAIGGLRYRFRQFDDPDLTIDLDDAQLDHRIDVSLTGEVPLTDTVAAFLRGSYTFSGSNYAIEEFENFAVTAGMRLRFGR